MAKSLIKKIWHFLWESDSPASWLICLALAFIIVKFIFFPLLSMVFASALPMVVVESTSMVHEGNFESFWTNFGEFYFDMDISKDEFSEFPLKNGFNKGDIMVIQGRDDYKVGEVIVFRVPYQSTPIIHRIIKIENGRYSTKGDHNPYQLSCENDTKKDQIIGRAIGRIPLLGYVKLAAVEFLRIFGIRI